MEGYKKPIINPNNSYKTAPKENKVTTIHVNDKVDTTETATINQSNDMIDQIADIAAKNAEENEDIERIRDLQHKEYEDRDINELTPTDAIEIPNTPDGVVAVERSFPVDASGRVLFTKEGQESCPAANVDILHVDDLDEFNKSEFKKNFIENTAKLHQITDEDAVGLLDVMTAYKKDKSISVYNKLPDGIKQQVREICMSAGMPLSNANHVAKVMLEQMIAETATDQTFIDFEKSINEAMKIPSMVDLYEEHIGETMNEKLPIMADAIRSEDPEKADMLLAIADRYNEARDLSKLRECFDTNSRVRKLMRRDYSKYDKFAQELNFMNEDSKFRMTDARTLYPILVRAIINGDDDNDFTEIDIQKFMVLLFRSCDNLHKNELLDAAYIYYLLKNISMLAYTDDESSKRANTFSVELISNIKAMMYYIRAKEEEFYACNKSSGSKK